MAYIDREAFKRKLVNEKSFYPAIVARALEEMPASDVVEVTKVVEMLCKIKTNIIKNVSKMIENDFSEIVKDALGERRDE
jgi:hypothetical protein